MMHAELGGLLVPSLRLKSVGFLHTPKDFRVGPRSIPEFGIVFVYAGRGWSVQKGVHRRLHGGEIFLIFPGIRYAFATDGAPWDVYWLNFTAPPLAAMLKRFGLTPRDYVRTGCDRECLKRLFEQIVIGVSAAGAS